MCRILYKSTLISRFIRLDFAVAQVFSSIFILEAVLKLIGFGKFYFMNGWNVFDLVIVVASIVDMASENIDGLSVLRTFRLVSHNFEFLSSGHLRMWEKGLGDCKR